MQSMLQCISWYHNLLLFLNHLRSSAALSYKWKTCVNHLHLPQMLSLSCPHFPLSPMLRSLTLFTVFPPHPPCSHHSVFFPSYLGSPSKDEWYLIMLGTLRGRALPWGPARKPGSNFMPGLVLVSLNLPINYTVNKDYFHGESKCNPDDLTVNHTTPHQGQSHYKKLCG